MKHEERDAELLADILVAAERIHGYQERFGNSLEEFLDDYAYQDSCMMQIVNIAERVKSLSSGFRDGHPEIPWGDISGMRNQLAHVYGNLDPEVAWETVEHDVPKLAVFCRNTLIAEFQREDLLPAEET